MGKPLIIKNMANNRVIKTTEELASVKVYKLFCLKDNSICQVIPSENSGCHCTIDRKKGCSFWYSKAALYKVINNNFMPKCTHVCTSSDNCNKIDVWYKLIGYRIRLNENISDI